jgi:predicted HTH transcriptional regulator
VNIHKKKQKRLIIKLERKKLRNILMKIHNIMRYIEKKKVITTSELAEEYKIAWNTAEKFLLEMVIDGKIIKLKKSGVNLWIAK